jgi:hypothetical protein
MTCTSTTNCAAAVVVMQQTRDRLEPIRLSGGTYTAAKKLGPSSDKISLPSAVKTLLYRVGDFSMYFQKQYAITSEFYSSVMDRVFKSS